MKIETLELKAIIIADDRRIAELYAKRIAKQLNQLLLKSEQTKLNNLVYEKVEQSKMWLDKYTAMYTMYCDIEIDDRLVKQLSLFR